MLFFPSLLSLLRSQACASCVLAPFSRPTRSHYKEKGVATFPSLLVLIRLTGLILAASLVDLIPSDQVEWKEWRHSSHLDWSSQVCSGWHLLFQPAGSSVSVRLRWIIQGRSACQGKYSLMTVPLPKNTLFWREEHIYHGYFVLRVNLNWQNLKNIGIPLSKSLTLCFSIPQNQRNNQRRLQTYQCEKFSGS